MKLTTIDGTVININQPITKVRSCTRVECADGTVWLVTETSKEVTDRILRAKVGLDE